MLRHLCGFRVCSDHMLVPALAGLMVVCVFAAPTTLASPKLKADTPGAEALRVAVMTLETGESPRERCLGYRVADELTELLRHAAMPGWVVLNRTPVLRIEASVFGEGVAAASRIATKLPATLVVMGRVAGEEIELSVYDARSVKASRAKVVTWSQTNPTETYKKLHAGLLKAINVASSEVTKEYAPAPYPEDVAACVLLGNVRATMKRGNAAFLQQAHDELLKVIAPSKHPARLLALSIEIQARLSSLKRDPTIQDGIGKRVAKLLALAPKMVETHWVRGLVKDFAGRSTQAIAAYRRAAVLDPGFSDPRVNLGRRLVKAGRLADALKVLQQAVVLDPNWPGALHNFAWALTKAGDGWGALNAIERLLAADEQSRTTVLPLKVLALIQVGSVEEALAHVTGAKSGKTWNMKLLEATALLAAGKYTDALDRLNELLGQDTKLDGLSVESQEAVLSGLVSKGRVFTAMGLSDKARALYENVIDKDPDIRHPQLRVALAVLEAASKGKESRARELLSEIVELDWWAGDEAWYNLAVLRHRSGELGLAAEAYEKAIFQNPRASWAFYNLGLVRMEQGGFDAAAEAFRRALALDPRAGDAANGLGVALCRAGHQEEGMTVWREWLQQATRLKPTPVIPAAIFENLGAVGAQGR